MEFVARNYTIACMDDAVVEDDWPREGLCMVWEERPLQQLQASVLLVAGLIHSHPVVMEQQGLYQVVRTGFVDREPAASRCYYYPAPPAVLA